MTRGKKFLTGALLVLLAVSGAGIGRRSGGDKPVILSTCEYSQENGRLAVIARKL